jgi:hypothetical protein
VRVLVSKGRIEDTQENVLDTKENQNRNIDAYLSVQIQVFLSSSLFCIVVPAGGYQSPARGETVVEW